MIMVSLKPSLYHVILLNEAVTIYSNSYHLVAWLCILSVQWSSP